MQSNEIIKCKWCGGPVIAPLGDGEYCSKEHKKLFLRRHISDIRAGAMKNKKICPACKIDFEPRSPHQIFCSKRCRTKRLLGAPIERVYDYKYTLPNGKEVRTVRLTSIQYDIAQMLAFSIMFTPDDIIKKLKPFGVTKEMINDMIDNNKPSGINDYIAYMKTTIRSPEQLGDLVTKLVFQGVEESSKGTTTKDKIEWVKLLHKVNMDINVTKKIEEDKSDGSKKRIDATSILEEAQKIINK